MVTNDTFADEDSYGLLYVGDTTSQPPIVVKMQFNNKPITLELDIRTTVTIMSSKN